MTFLLVLLGSAEDTEAQSPAAMLLEGMYVDVEMSAGSSEQQSPPFPPSFGSTRTPKHPGGPELTSTSQQTIAAALSTQQTL